MNIMGSEYEIECKNCGYKTMITIGVGMSPIYNEVKSAITLLSSHSLGFWKNVESLFPTYKKWKRWLRINGRILDLRI